MKVIIRITPFAGKDAPPWNGKQQDGGTVSGGSLSENGAASDGGGASAAVLTGVEMMEVEYRIEGLTAGTETVLASFQEEAAGIPGCARPALCAWDAAGELPLRERTRREYPVVSLDLYPERASEGDIWLRYRCAPRILDASGRRGPLLDFRGEPGGAAGAGEAFLARLEGEGEWELCWDLSNMPEGSRAAGTFGGLRTVRIGAMDDLLYSYYAVGDVRAEETGQFGVYWLGEPPFDLTALAARTRAMYEKMAEFFRDPDPLYRIFVRRDPFCPSGSGTALNRSYMFGYCEKEIPSPDTLHNLLAHEMVHNWPHLKDEPYGSTAWYTEGTAEYYSVLLSLRFGFASLEETLSQIQSRTDRYFTNPTRYLSDEEAAERFWTDLRTQRLSYGRGFFFLGHTDAELRKATAGARSLDDVVLELLLLGREKGSHATAADFERIVSGYLGRDYGPEIGAMKSGTPFRPDRDGFDGLFDYEEVPAAEADTGKTVSSYRWFVRNEQGAAGNRKGENVHEL